MSEDGWVELSDAIGVVREQLIAAQTVRRHTVAGEGENVEHDAGGWQRGGRLLGSCLAEVQATLQRREVDPSLIPEDELSIEHHFDIGADADEPCSVALPVTLVGRVEVESTCALTPGTRHAADRARRQGSEGHVSRARGGAGRRRGDSRGVAGRPAAERRPAAESTGSMKVQHVLEVVGLFVAPVTLVTAILYWFGLELTGGRAGWFGLPTSMLGFSTTDYLVRGTEAGVVPLIVLFLAVLAGVAVHGGLGRLAARRSGAQWYRPVLAAAAVVGGILSAAGAIGAFTPLPPPVDGYLVPPVLLATAPLFTLYVGRLLLGDVDRRYVRVAAVATIGLAVLGIFWATSLYADALGRGRGQQLASNLGSLPAVTVYSERSLALDVIPSEPLADTENSRYTDRYFGMRLLLFSGGRYFLLPDAWTPETGTVVVLADTPELRVEISPGG